MNTIPLVTDPERTAQGARQIAMDQIEAAAQAGLRARMEYWAERWLSREMLNRPQGSLGGPMEPDLGPTPPEPECESPDDDDQEFGGRV